jgi:metal-responsive CopG/Arc/MetJ family transcriptional regulator
MEQPIGIRLSKEMLKNIESLSKQELEDRSTTIRKLVLIGYLELMKKKVAQFYAEGKITITEAANQTNLTIWEMEKYLIDQGFKSEYSIDDLEKENKTFEK